MSEPEKEKKKINLSGKQKLFADFYLGEAHFNGTKAAELAEYQGNKATLAAVAYENLRKPQIKAYIDERLSAMTMPGNVVLTRLTEIAEGKVTDFLDDKKNFDLEKAKKAGKDGLLRKIKIKKTIRATKLEVNEEIKAVLDTDEIEAFNKTELVSEEVEFEIYSAHDALRDLGKHHKLFTEKHEHSNPDGTPLGQNVADALTAFEKSLLKIYDDQSSEKQD